MSRVVQRALLLTAFIISLPLIALAPAIRGDVPVAYAARAVTSERALLWGKPYDGDWSGIGAYMGTYNYEQPWSWLPSETIKASFSQFANVASDGYPGKWPRMSWSRISELDRQERNAGRAPILMTGTYNGASRPLYFNWSVGFVGDGQSPTTASGQWRQGINLTSPAYMDYYVNEVLKPYLYSTRYSNWWISFDECAFHHRLYGVIDNGAYRHPQRWDSPFPQNEAEYLQAVKNFFSGIKQRLPGLKLMCNDGGQSNYSDFTNVYSSLDGAFQEDLFYFVDMAWSEWSRDEFALRLQTMKWLADQGKVHLQCFKLDNSSDLTTLGRTAYAMYALTRGDSTFFCPHTDMLSGDNAFPEVHPNYYSGMQQALGAPAGAYEVLATGGQGYFLYSRRMQGGLVYFNYTGQNRTVQLPSGASYRDRAGNAVTSLWLPNLTGDYVTFGSSSAPPLPPPTDGGGGAVDKPVINSSVSAITAGSSLNAAWEVPLGWGPAPTTRDWIALFPVGSVNAGEGYGWMYTSSCGRTPGSVVRRSGACQFTVPSSTPAGTYQLRLYSSDGYSRLAASSPPIAVSR